MRIMKTVKSCIALAVALSILLVLPGSAWSEIVAEFRVIPGVHVVPVQTMINIPSINMPVAPDILAVRLASNVVVMPAGPLVSRLAVARSIVSVKKFAAGLTADVSSNHLAATGHAFYDGGVAGKSSDETEISAGEQDNGFSASLFHRAGVPSANKRSGMPDLTLKSSKSSGWDWVLGAAMLAAIGEAVYSLAKIGSQVFTAPRPVFHGALAGVGLNDGGLMLAMAALVAGGFLWKMISAKASRNPQKT
jgi:hypothetical protein